MADGDICINGKMYDSEDMTFREQREMRRVIREHIVESDDVDMDSLALADVLPAMVYVIARRDNPDFTLDEALDMKMKDVMVEKEARPTKRSASVKK